MNRAFLKNGKSILIDEIPILKYEQFYEQTCQLLDDTVNHCVAYHGYMRNKRLFFICAIANDEKSEIYVYAHEQTPNPNLTLLSLTAKHYAMHVYERELHENWGVQFSQHPWLKPIRYPYNRTDRSKTINTYPFYYFDSEEYHEVGVGPIHAGVIEPGHFRFLCVGEEVKHLEIQLGWQHRGVEALMLQKKKLIERTCLVENIAGDSTVGHTLGFVHVMEALGNCSSQNEALAMNRSIALELERIAIHTGDLSGICTDVAFQLGSAVFGALRTPLINYFQFWCGNRFAKGLLRVGYSPYMLDQALVERLLSMTSEYSWRFREIAEKTFSMASSLGRFEGTGIVTTAQAQKIGAVGMAARMAGVQRDVRSSHPFEYFKELPIQSVVLSSGDVFARGLLRRMEVEKSLNYISSVLQAYNPVAHESMRTQRKSQLNLRPDSFALAMVEGWRGQIVHSAFTTHEGELAHYKVTDPSLFNWLALALAVRNNGISDFPICNKSFNLSYCGNDL